MRLIRGRIHKYSELVFICRLFAHKKRGQTKKSRRDRDVGAKYPS